MGWKSTMDITRKDAKRLIKERWKQASNSALEAILEILGDDNDKVNGGLHGHNFTVVSQYSADSGTYQFGSPEKSEKE